MLAAGCAGVDRFADFRRYEQEANGRFLGVLGFALDVPGVKNFEQHYPFATDVFIIPKTSDAFLSREELEYNHRAREFALDYNTRLLKAKKPKRIRTNES